MRSFNDNQKWVGHKRHKLHEICFSSFTTLDSDIKKMKITIYSNSHSKQNIVITKQLERSKQLIIQYLITQPSLHILNTENISL